MEYANRKTVILILLISFACVDCLGQETQKSGDSVEVWIQGIKNEYTRINKDTTKFKKVQKDVNDQSSEGGILIKYYDNKILRKAVLTFFGETGQSITEYYFLNGEIIFVFQKEERYKASIYMGKTETKGQEETRFYFKYKKLIQWIVNNGKIVDAGQYPEKEKEVLDDIKLFINSIKPSIMG